jgi:hypothetical protein
MWSAPIGGREIMTARHSHLFENERDGEFTALASVDAMYSHDDVESANSAENVLGEIGLVLVVVLGIAVGINLMLTALHIG